MNTYTLFVGEDCHQCADVISYLENNAITFKKVNVDTSEEKPPKQIYAFPALFEAEELVGYGTDIKRFFTKKSHSK